MVIHNAAGRHAWKSTNWVVCRIHQHNFLVSHSSRHEFTRVPTVGSPNRRFIGHARVAIHLKAEVAIDEGPHINCGEDGVHKVAGAAQSSENNAVLSHRVQNGVEPPDAQRHCVRVKRYYDLGASQQNRDIERDGMPGVRWQKYIAKSFLAAQPGFTAVYRPVVDNHDRDIGRGQCSHCVQRVLGDRKRVPVDDDNGRPGAQRTLANSGLNPQQFDRNVPRPVERDVIDDVSLPCRGPMA